MQTFRVFVSSPGDAAVERRRAENVVSRLNGEFVGLARLVAVRWETEHYRAHDTFQAQIPDAADCEIVVGILKWRLGTELPAGFPGKMATGEPYPSGTAYEILSAIEKRRHGAELPDVYVFRYVSGAPSPPLDDPDRTAIEHEWNALRGFIHRWFETPDGHFIAAFNPYRSEDDFEAQLEALLRKWCAGKVSGGKVVLWPEAKGSPFRGLSVFGAKHAPVFFGRSNDVRRAVEQWRAGAAKGTPFLLVVGASGAGKSSLARAGLLPRLTTPGVVAEVDLWRVAALRPGDDPAGPFAALAAALMQNAADVPPDDEGRGPALPEIAEGDCRTAAELAAVLAHADAAAARPLLNALARVGERARDRDRYGREVRCGLILLVDQLDELFSASVTPQDRVCFAALLAALAASRRIWLVATLRADLYGSMLEVAPLQQLKDAGASYDLAPPGPAELAEIVRSPAAAAGLVYERDPSTGESLDERLLREADRPDMLPLVQLALSRLYEGRETRGAATLLPLDAYARIGGLPGIIDEAGERALAEVGEAERSRLPPLIRQLAEIAQGLGAASAGALAIRAAPLDRAAPDDAGRRLVDALVAARLATLSGHGEAAQLRLAHQRVLTDWARAASIVAESGDFYRIRDEVDRQRRRWEAGGRRGELLLARGLPLAEAENIDGKYGTELGVETRAFVAASRRRANRAQIIGWSAAAVFAVVAAGALWEWRTAVSATARADRNFAAAKETIRSLIFDIADGLKDVVGIRVETVQKVLSTVKGTVDQLVQTAPDDEDLQNSQGIMWGVFSRAYLAAGDTKGAQEAAARGIGIMRALVARNPGDRHRQHNLALMIQTEADAKLAAADRAGAVADYESALAIDRAGVAQNPADAAAQYDLASSLQRIGDARWGVGDRAGELAAYQEALDILRKLAARSPADAAVTRSLTVLLGDVAGVKLDAGDVAGALAAYQEALDTRRRLAADDPSNVQAQRDVSTSLESVGKVKLQSGDSAGALAAFGEALDIRHRRVAQDGGNAEAQRDLAVILGWIGAARFAANDIAEALAACDESLGIRRRLVAHDPDSTEAKSDLAEILERIGALKLAQGDKPGAEQAYREAADLRRRLDARDPGNPKLQKELAVSLDGLGGLELSTGDTAKALAAYRESLDLYRKLAGADSGSPGIQRDLAVCLRNLGDAMVASGNPKDALRFYQQSRDLSQQLAERQPGSARAQSDVAASIEKIGDAQALTGDQAAAAASYDESLAIRRKLAKDDGAPQWQSSLVLSIEKVAAFEWRTGSPAKALADYEEASPIVRKLAATLSGADGETARRNLASILEHIGTLKLQAGDRDGALAAFHEAVDLLRKSAASASTNAGADGDLAQALENLGDAAWQAGDTAGALAAYQEGLAIMRTIAAKASIDTQALRSLAMLLDKIGAVEVQTGQKARALDAYADSIATARKLIGIAPDDPQAGRLLAIGLGFLGEMKLQAGDKTGALAAFQESLALIHKLAERDPDGVTARSDLPIGLARIAQAKAALDDRPGTLEAYVEIVALRRKLAVQASADAGAQRDLATALIGLGDAELWTGDRTGALGAYQESLDIARKLAARDADNAQAQIDLDIALVRLASVSPDPAPLYREALASLKTLDGQGKLGAQQKTWIANLEAQLAAPPAPP